MKLICIDYLKLDRSKGGYEDLLVITDHFSRYAKAIPTKNQTAYTTAKALYEKKKSSTMDFQLFCVLIKGLILNLRSSRNYVK